MRFVIKKGLLPLRKQPWKNLLPRIQARIRIFKAAFLRRYYPYQVQGVFRSIRNLRQNLPQRHLFPLTRRIHWRTGYCTFMDCYGTFILR